MNAAGRRCKQFANGFRHLAVICGKSYKGGRPAYKRTSNTVAEAIARERAAAAREQQRKAKKK